MDVDSRSGLDTLTLRQRKTEQVSIMKQRKGTESKGHFADCRVCVCVCVTLLKLYSLKPSPLVRVTAKIKKGKQNKKQQTLR